MRYLDKISDPADLQQFSERELTLLADEVRETILACVSETGGHLAASLGTVELTVALHSVLREPAGTRSSGTWATSATRTSCSPAAATASARSGSTAACPGFPNRAESPHDVVGTGHASTSISYGLGLVEAERIAREDDGNVVCVARRRRPHGRGRLRGAQPGRPPAHAARGRPQRQRDVDPRQRRRPAALPQPHPPRPDAHASARGPRARRRARSRPSAARRTGWARTSRSR